MAKDEPQSYGNRPEQPASSQHADPETCATEDAQNPVQKVTARESGAKRRSFWKERDYKS